MPAMLYVMGGISFFASGAVGLTGFGGGILFTGSFALLRHYRTGEHLTVDDVLVLSFSRALVSACWILCEGAKRLTRHYTISLATVVGVLCAMPLRRSGKVDLDTFLAVLMLATVATPVLLVREANADNNKPTPLENLPSHLLGWVGIAATASGIVGTLSGTPGVPLMIAAALVPLEKTSTRTLAAANTLLLCTFNLSVVLDQWTVAWYETAVVLACASAGTWAGSTLHAYVDATTFSRCLYAILLGYALELDWKAALATATALLAIWGVARCSAFKRAWFSGIPLRTTLL